MGSKKNIIRNKIRHNAKHKVDELVSCYGKIRYNPYEEAKTKNDFKYGLVKAYKCKHCKFYHIGRNQEYKNKVS